MAVIPTSFKYKIPRTLSYTTGAEIFSRAFADVPQFSELSIDFRFMSRERFDGIYSVVEIAYRRMAKSIHTREDDLERWLKPRWSIVVYAVPRTRRHLIKSRLEEFLPSARAWLTKNANKDEVGHLELIFSFDEEKADLTSSESSSLEPRRWGTFGDRGGGASEGFASGAVASIEWKAAMSAEMSLRLSEA